MSLTFAYCVQLDALVDIVEAMDFYFSQEPPRQDLQFLCPDEACRKQSGAKIIAVNYKKIHGQDIFVQRAHFKVDARYPHYSACPWSEIVDAQMRIGAVSSNGTEIYHHFKPLASDQKSNESNNAIPDDVVGKIKKICGKAERVNAYIAYMEQNPRSTSRLYNIVRCYEGMDDEKLRVTPLRIGSLATRTFWKYVVPVRYCSTVEFYPKIYKGYVKVKKWKSGYSVRFRDRARQPDGVLCTVSVFLSNESLVALSGCGLLMATLEAAIDAVGNSAYCYVFGHVARNPQNIDWIDISLDSLHSIVLMLIDQG